jgi:Domain of unknown function (DUF1707)
MDTPNSSFPRGDLRVSDADRDRAIAELSEHFQTGRLAQEEFEDRSGRALRARTGTELSELFTDLPRSMPPAMAASPGPVSRAGRAPSATCSATFSATSAALTTSALAGWCRS